MLNLYITGLSSDYEKSVTRSENLSEHDSNSNYFIYVNSVTIIEYISNSNIFDLPCCLLQDSLLGLF